MRDKLYGSFFPKWYRIVKQEESADGYEFHLKSASRFGVCPVCGGKSSRVHGNERRTVRDLPILGKAVTLKINRKKYFCDTNGCGVDIFAEQNDFIDYYSQFTARCKEYMLKVATRTSGEAAAKILSYQGIRVSGETLLNMLKAAGEAHTAHVGKKIGVDDWAYRRGKSYGTIICDLETHDVLDVLEGRGGETLEEWLKGHPDIEVVSRDRASAYSAAVSRALPQAVQVADRFHITKNLLDALNDTMKGFLPEVIRIPSEADCTGGGAGSGSAPDDKEGGGKAPGGEIDNGSASAESLCVAPGDSSAIALKKTPRVGSNRRRTKQSAEPKLKQSTD